MKKIALILICLALNAGAQHFVGNSFENLNWQLGKPDHSVDFGNGITVLVYDNQNEFFYIDVQSQIVILQRSYISARMARILTRRMNQNLTVFQGWYYLPDLSAAVRISIDAGNYRFEMKVNNSPLTQLIP